MRYKIIVLFIIITLFSCTHDRKASDFINLGGSQIEYNSVDKYISENKLEVVNDNIWIEFMFLNNPYNLNDNNLVSIHINNHLVYRGIYKRQLKLYGEPSEIFSKDSRMTVTMEILTDRDKEPIWLHSFQSKTEFSWNKDYKIIYCGFFPTNEDVEKVYFIPQLESLI